MSFLKYIANYRSKPLNLDNWTEYGITEFFTVKQSDGDNQAQKLEDGDIPLISSGSYNNGVCKYIDRGDGESQLFAGQMLTVDMFGKAFYQEKPFYAVSHARVNILIPKDGWPFNKYIALFLVAVMDNTFRNRYSYEEMCGATSLEKEGIMLPTLNGSPDWKYMENQIRAIYPYMESLVK